MSRLNIQGFTDKEIDYYSRQIVLKDFGIKAQRRLNESKILIAGAGGLGSPLATQLASMGVGHIRIIDRDVVETSNLQRQHLYGTDVVGLPKVEAAEMRLRRLNPFIEIEPIPMSVTPRNASRLVEGMDVIVDGLDSMAPRYALNRACVEKGIPYVYGAVIMQMGTVSTIIPGETACLECFQGGINDADLPTCAVAGVHPSAISMVASAQVSETIRILIGQTPVLSNILLFCDLAELSLEKIKLTKIENCPVCGSNPTKEPYKLTESLVEEVCGREGRRVFVFSPDEDMGLDLTQISDKIMDSQYIITSKGKMGISFKKNKIIASVLSSGVAIIEGVSGQEEAETLYSWLKE